MRTLLTLNCFFPGNKKKEGENNCNFLSVYFVIWPINIDNEMLICVLWRVSYDICLLSWQLSVMLVVEWNMALKNTLKKITVFMWKAFHSFPLANLHKRGSDGLTICTCCGEYPESSFSMPNLVVRPLRVWGC